MKNLLYLAVSTIILAPVFVAFCATNLAVAFCGVLYCILLCAVSHHPVVRKFILRVYRAQLSLFSGKLMCEL